MKLSISNIAWEAEQDAQVYGLMKRYGYFGLEIAPTRIFPHAPYEHLKDARVWSQQLWQEYGFVVSSMQSIWFGRQEKIFGSDKERRNLMDYTKKAIAFAEAIGCKNLVFGCPRNRCVPEGADLEIGVRFFKEIADEAAHYGIVIGLEANPPIYHTNYINDTSAAFELIHKVDSRGFLLNLDVGTMIENREPLSVLAGRGARIHHVHISEPGLQAIEERMLHEELKQLLQREGYQGFVSIEMGKGNGLAALEERMDYVRRIFNE